MKKILLLLQFWEGDRDQAMRTARLIADLQPGFCDIADFMFVARFDSTNDGKTMDYVSRKFHVHSHVNTGRRGVGWPSGCNDLFFGSIDHVYSHRLAERLPDYKAVLTFEADCCPLHPEWVSTLSAAWDKAGTKMYGPVVSGPGMNEHCNGNTFVSGDLEHLRWLAREIGGCSPHVGWDYLLYPKFLARGVKNAPEMRSIYRAIGFTPEVFAKLRQQGVSFVHGVKDDSLEKIVREKFLK